MVNRGVKRRRTDQGSEAAHAEEKITKKDVARIARNVALKAAETKSFISNVSGGSQTQDAVVATNLIYSIGQGVTAESVIGEKVFIKNIHLKGYFNTDTTNDAACTLRCALVRTKKALTNSRASITVTDAFRTNVTNEAALGHFDLHKVDVLWDKMYKVGIPNISGLSMTQAFDFNVPINKTHYFDADNSGYFKDKNYYLIVTAYKEKFGTVTPGFMSLQWTVNFKDE